MTRKAYAVGIALAVLALGSIIMLYCCSNIYKVGEISIQKVPMNDGEIYEDFTVRFEIEVVRLKNDRHQVLFSEIIKVLRTGEISGIIIYR